jgi:subtilase family serine protease
MSASLSGAVAVFDSFMGSPGRWISAGGTSEATPEFAGVVAIADHYANWRFGLINPALYRLQHARARGVIDVSKGNNTVAFVQSGTTFALTGYRAKRGYDLVTGIGSVDAARFVPALAKFG